MNKQWEGFKEGFWTTEINVRNFIKTNNASVSKLQRIFNIGFNRAGRIVDQMESAGFVSPKDSKNNRVIFCTQQEFEERFGEDL